MLPLQPCFFPYSLSPQHCQSPDRSLWFQYGGWQRHERSRAPNSNFFQQFLTTVGKERKTQNIYDTKNCFGKPWINFQISLTDLFPQKRETNGPTKQSVATQWNIIQPSKEWSSNRGYSMDEVWSPHTQWKKRRSKDAYHTIPFSQTGKSIEKVDLWCSGLGKN